MSATRKIAVQDIYAAPGVLAFRVGDPVPESAVKNLDAADKVANETTKTAQTALDAKAKVEKAPRPDPMASTHRIDIDRRALDVYVNTSDEARRLFAKIGRDIRDEARTGARAISSKTDAIVSQVENDADGIYVDVGYLRHHPGFFLWFYEVGTRRDAPRPHLRPALRLRY